MKSGNAGRENTLVTLFAFGHALEKRGNKPFTQLDLAKTLGISSRTVTRYLTFFRDELGLVIESPKGSRGGSAVQGKWRFMDAMSAYYRRGV